MIDPFGREITYLRVSVTDHCDFRCTYCMGEKVTFLPKAEVLTLEEIDRVCGAFIIRGVRKLRITGGEPLVRRNIISLFRSLGRHLATGALDEIVMTTNGSRLERLADGLFASGLGRINVSLDTLDPAKFQAITRHGRLDRVLAGLAAAKAAGLKVKINTVALKGINEDEADDLVAWCGGQSFDLTFIETMPLGDIGGDRTERYMPVTEIRRRLEQNWTLSAISDNTGGPSRYVRVAETGQRIGFITPLSRHFCDTCNRVRLTCTGILYMCLGKDDRVDLRPALRMSESDGPLLAAIDGAIARKPKGHDFAIDPGNGHPSITRHMNVTGG